MRVKAWVWVLLFTVVIYATLPVAPVLWRSFARQVGDWAEVLVVAGLVLTGVGVSWFALRNLRSVGRKRVAALVGVAAAYVVILATVELTPAEKLHFLYYGFLALLVYRALEIDLAGGSLLIATVIVVTIIGFGDEVLQGIIPRRFFEWKDVALNGVSGLLATILILVFKPVGEDATS